MRWFRGVPLAWLNLSHDQLRFGLFAAGIGFAVVLMFLQYGCRNALIDSNLLLMRHVRADLVLVHKRAAALAIREPIPALRLVQARKVPGVASVHPLQIEYDLTSLRQDDMEGPSRTVRVIGVDLDAHLLKFPALDPNDPNNKIAALRKTGAALFDTRSRRAEGKPGESVFGAFAPGATGSLAGRRIEVVGTFALGSDFACEGSLIVSADTFSRWLRQFPSPGSGYEGVEAGLVRLESGQNVEQARRAIEAALPEGDVDVLTLDGWMEREKSFWLHQTPIGIVFGFGMIMGFVVGTVICYQVLASDVADHLAEYATLKAMGYTNAQVRRVVLLEACYLGLAGFVPGLLVSAVLYAVLAWLTDLPMDLTPGRIARVAVATAVMCVISGLLAVRKVEEADPAEVFG